MNIPSACEGSPNIHHHIRHLSILRSVSKEKSVTVGNSEIEKNDIFGTNSMLWLQITDGKNMAVGQVIENEEVC